MKSFTTRVISALVAIAAVVLLYYFYAEAGLKVLVLIAALVGGSEVSKILFTAKDPRAMKALFYFFNLFLFLALSLYPNLSGIILAVGFILYSILAVLFHRCFQEINEVRDFVSKSMLGFLYIGLLPSVAWAILNLPHGSWWFFLLFSVVFSGDVGAYIFGMLWGKTKLMPKLSPKKSLQGSIGGVLFSVIAACVCNSVQAICPWASLVALAIVAGLVGQLGDFFESLLKRIADVKDSGKLMPGHGGLLDRIDGVIFASPVILCGALYFESLF